MVMLALRNEAMDLFVKTKNKEKALESADAAMAILNNAMLDTRNAQATITMSAARVYAVFGEREKALFLYITSVEYYEKNLQPTDPRLANIYNNIALNISSLGEGPAALDLYEKAINIIKMKPESAPEEALTHLNIAYLLKNMTENGSAEEVNRRIEKANELIDSCIAENTYDAAVCEKCAHSFAALGKMSYQKELLARASRINAVCKHKGKK